jgi:phosphate transport system substrate-binding protein
MNRYFQSIIVTALLVAAVLAAPLSLPRVAGANPSITGAGASFPYPVYSLWMHEYHKMFGVKVNYQSIGSGGGIAQIKAKTVDFGASDAPLKEKDLKESGLIQFPMIVGGVVPVVNIKGVKSGKLRLSKEVLAGIFLGDIRKWNDKRIKAVNPGLVPSDIGITVVHRGDGSGTTWIFTNFLDKISKTWHEKVGTGKAVKWPVGIGAKGNEGVSAYVQRIPGAIGYVEYAYAMKSKIPVAMLENKDGSYVPPTIETFQAAAANANWAEAPGFYMVLTNQPGRNSWPITGASFILIHKKQQDKNMARALLNYFKWSLTHGGDTARKLHYVPIPAKVVSMIEDLWRKQVRADGEPVGK